MYRDVYTTIRPILEDAEETAYATAEVLDIYSLLEERDIAEAEEMSVEDALDTLLENESLPHDVSASVAVSILRASGIRDLNPAVLDVTGTTLYLGSSDFLDAVHDVVPGRWTVLFTSSFTAVVCEEVLFDEDEGFFERADHDASNCYGVFVDPTVSTESFDAFGPAVSPDGFTIRSTLGRFKSATHRRVDGRCDAIFLTENSK